MGKEREKSGMVCEWIQVGIHWAYWNFEYSHESYEKERNEYENS